MKAASLQGIDNVSATNGAINRNSAMGLWVLSSAGPVVAVGARCGERVQGDEGHTATRGARPDADRPV